LSFNGFICVIKTYALVFEKDAQSDLFQSFRAAPPAECVYVSISPGFNFFIWSVSSAWFAQLIVIGLIPLVQLLNSINDERITGP
jgi:hypothetical protein